VTINAFLYGEMFILAADIVPASSEILATDVHTKLVKCKVISTIKIVGLQDLTAVVLRSSCRAKWNRQGSI
jgi:hypothetical protein